MIAYLCLGSNMGDARAFVERAASLIESTHINSEATRTQEIESEPWGYDSVYAYVNMTIRLDIPIETTAENALRLLDSMQKIEKEISDVPHRNSDGTYRDREIDIDIIAIEGLRMEHPRLSLPHPRAAERDFVRIPMEQLGAAHLLAPKS